MLYIKYFNYLISLLLFILPHSSPSMIVKKICGDYIFQIETFNSSSLYERQFVLYYQLKGQKKKMFYKTEIGMGLDATCIKNREKRYILLFREFCSGNACPENIYGLFDPLIGKFLLEPSAWPEGNKKQVRKLTGYSPSVLNKNEYFCCNVQ